MGDSTPLIISCSAPTELHLETQLEDSPTPSDNNVPSISIDELIERCTGDFGWQQFLQAILVSAATIFDAQQSFISIFSDADPTWHCTAPLDKSSGCNPAEASGFCRLPPAAWAWDRPAWTSTKSEWNLQCAAGGSVVGGLPASSFFAGCFIGNIIFTVLADSTLGRKSLLLLSCLVMSLTTLLTAVSTNVWIYSLLRFVCGLARAPICTFVLVLATELVGKRWRSQVGITGLSFFTVGFLSLPALAFAYRLSSWRALYVWTSIPVLIYCLLVHFFVHESPRWLFTRGRKDEALAVLKKLSEPQNNSDGNNLLFCDANSLKVEVVSAGEAADIYASLKMLTGKRWAFRRMMAVMVLGIGIGIMYYGMPLGVGNLGFNLYWSTALNAMSEIPSNILAMFLIGRWGRRRSLLAFNTLSGLTSIACGVIGYAWRDELWGLQVVLELVSFCIGYLSFSFVLIYTLELFPTCVRNTAVSLMRQAVIFSAVFCPLLVAAGSDSGGLLSYGVFGLVIQLTALVLGYLPETKGAGLCDTMDEQERKEARERTMVA